MKNRAKQGRNDSARGISHRSLVGVVAITVLLIGIVTAFSTQRGQTQKTTSDDAKSEKKSPQVANQSRGNYVTANPAGQIVAVDRQTGQERDLTPEEARRLAEGIKQLVNQSTDGLVQVKHEDGSVSMDLEGRFQNVMLAKKEADGSVSHACVDNLEAAAAFFEIDPKLLGLPAPTSKKNKVPTKLEDR